MRRDRIRPQRLQSGRRPFDRVRQELAAPGDLPAGRAKDDHRQRRHDAARRPADAARTRQHRRHVLRQDGNLRAASPSLRVQQRLSPAVHRPRHAVLRHEPRRLAGRSDRAARASVVPGRAVSSRVQIEADGAAAAVRRLHRRGGRTQQGPRRAYGGEEARDEGTSRPTPQRISLHSSARAMADDKKIIIDEDWKSQVQAEKEAAAKAKPAPSRAEPRANDSGARATDPPMPPASFEMLVTTLATEALMASARCRIPSPARRKCSAIRPSILIDTIDVLRQKTAGQPHAGRAAADRQPAASNADGVHRGRQSSRPTANSSAAVKNHTQPEHRWQTMPATPLNRSLALPFRLTTAGFCGMRTYAGCGCFVEYSSDCVAASSMCIECRRIVCRAARASKQLSASAARFFSSRASSSASID